MTGEQTATPTVTVTGGVAAVVERLQRALHLLDVHERDIPTPGVAEQDKAAERAEAMAELSDRRRTLWEQLGEWVYGPAGTVPVIFGKAAIEAADAAASDARFWAETAQFWRDRAAGLPADDGTGAMGDAA